MRDLFVVPEAFLKTLRPHRSIPGSAIAPTEASAQKLLARIAKAYQAPTHYHERRSQAKIYAAGLKTQQEPALAPVRQAAHELLLRLDLEAVHAVELDALAAACKMAARVDRASLTPAIVVARGLSDAVRVAWRASQLGLDAEGGYTTAVFVITADDLARRGGEPWPELRHAVCAASEQDYVAARETARALRGDSDLVRRAAIASVFPDEPWGTEDLLAGLADPTLPPAHRGLSFLLSATTSVDAVRASVAQAGPHAVATYALDLAFSLPWADVLPILEGALGKLLERPKYGPVLKTPPRTVAQTIACFRREEAAAILAPYATNTILGPLVLGYFRDAPELGHVLQRQAKGKGKLGETVDRVLGKRRAADAKPAKAAKRGEVPALLLQRPWRAGESQRGRGQVVRGLTLLGLDRARVVIDRSPAPFVPYRNSPIRDMTKQELAAWRASLEKKEHVPCDYEHRRLSRRSNTWEYMRIPDAEGLRAWNEGDGHLKAGPLLFVARHGLAAIPGFLRREWINWLAYEESNAMLPAALALASPLMAPSIARVAARRKRYRRVTLAWILEHAEIAASGLVPDAVGDPGEARTDAEAALLFLAQKGQGKIVRRVAMRYGKATDAVIAELLDRDPLAISAHVPKPPAFLRLAELPLVRVRSGRVLPEEAHAALVELLQLTPLNPPYPGLALVREGCDADSLGRLALELAEQWVLGDAPGRHEWMLLSIAHFPSDEAARRVAALAREWARRDQKKAERACIALASLGTDFALLHLAHIAETTRFDALRKTTAALLLEAADRQGLSPDELGDRTVPDLGLGADGTLALSYGPRSFVVSLDETLAPVVRELTKAGPGPRLRTLPRAAKTDDADAARAARTRYDALKADLAAVADRQRRRLERAMADERSWPLEQFLARIARHPLLLHLARRLVWEATSARRASSMFRIAEDSTLADERDRATKLDGKQTVRVAHPARDPARVAAWLPIFSDYALLQPFEQLARATFVMTAAEARATALERAAGITTKAAKVLGVLESRGWRRNDAGFVTSYLRDGRASDGSPVVARLPLAPGISMEDLASCPDQKTEALVVELAGQPDPVAVGRLAPVCFSELVRDIEALRVSRS